MFEVFGDMSTGVYKRNVVATKPPKNPSLKIDGPLEIRGTVQNTITDSWTT